MTPGDGTADASNGDGNEGSTDARSAGRRRRTVLMVVAAACLVVIVGLAIVVSRLGEGDPGPLDADAPALGHAKFKPTGCAFEPDRGGLVTHFDVRSGDTGRFTVDVRAVTAEGVDNLDITTPYVVRYTVAFDGSDTRKQFDVVVPLTQAEYDQGYQKCRYSVNSID